jgi:hypothetical protein
VAASAVIALSYMGTHHYGIRLPPAERIAQHLAPQEGIGMLREVPFDQLEVGVLDIHGSDATILPPKLEEVFSRFKALVLAAERNGELPGASGVLLIEDWQADLKRVTLRIGWENRAGEGRTSFERMVHLHRLR